MVGSSPPCGRSRHNAVPAPSLGSRFTRIERHQARDVGASALRPDGVPKVTGQFPFSSDLHAEGMLWGRVLRSPHAAARIVAIDTAAAERLPGVRAVVTAADVPGAATFGLEHRDQPVFASDVVRYHGEPVAAVAADDPETARRACEAISVTYARLEPLLDPELAFDAPPIHPDGNVFRSQRVRYGDTSITGDVVVEGTYEVGMQDQAFLGTESGLAQPTEDGGVALQIATQWLHADRGQIASCLGLPHDKVQLSLAGVGGAFGAREDISLQIHACLLALRTGRPVKMLFSREESFLGHVHRHPARMWYRHHASHSGELLKIEARLVLDGGAYASSSTAVIANAVCFAVGPYRVRAAVIDGHAVRTNHPPCGAMRGFGAVQVCFAHEAQMDKLARRLDIDPLQLRLQNALASGDSIITGQVIRGAAPVRDVLLAAAAHPLPPPPEDSTSMLALPGGAGRTATRANVRRGIGFAAGYKNLAFSEGFDDYSTARVRLEVGADGQPRVRVQCAAAEVGQGFVTLAQQIARAELGVGDVSILTADTRVGSAGSTSASRQTWMSGGAVQVACAGVREALFERVSELHGVGPTELAILDGAVVSADGLVREPLARAIGTTPLEVTREYRHPQTQPLDENGQGNAHVSWAFAAHRAVVDVDVELGLVRVIQIATGQDAGNVLNPLQATGQIEGGIAQGVGLAVMEELVFDSDGRLRNASFTDYLIPTTLDMPDVLATLIEEPEPGAPFGAKGIGEPPTISSTAAVLGAIRAATGLDLTRVPLRPQDIALAAEGAVR
jgi:xanthine dehydrogenase D subunit